MALQSQCVRSLEEEIPRLQQPEKEFRKSSAESLPAISHASPENLSSRPFDVAMEFNILKGIRDIIEEISMLHHIVDQQIDVIRMLEHVYRHHADGHDSESSPWAGFSVESRSAQNSRYGRKVLSSAGSARNRSATSGQPEHMVFQGGEREMPSRLIDRATARKEIINRLDDKAQQTYHAVGSFSSLDGQH